MADPIFYGIGVGPGDPELMTLKAQRLIRSVDVVTYIVNTQGYSLARDIASDALAGAPTTQVERPIEIAMCKDRDLANQTYDEAAEAIAGDLREGRHVAFLCQGDPLFFGSFAYLLERLQPAFDCRVVPGISSVHCASAATATPLALLTENLAVISARHSDQAILNTLAEFDNVVIMKAGSARPRLLELLRQSGRQTQARYLAHIGQTQETLVDDIDSLPDTSGPYFSLFLINRHERNTR